MKDSARRELETLDKLARMKLSASEYTRWQKVGSGHRFMAGWNKIVVVYKVGVARPQVIAKLKCVALEAALQTGLRSEWLDLASGIRYWFSHEPTEIAPGVFIGHTLFSGVELASPGQYGLRFSMYSKQQHNPVSRVQGAYYILEKAVFDTQYGE